MFTEIDESKPYTVITVIHPVQLFYFRRAVLAPGQYRVQGDIRNCFRHVSERRKITSGMVRIDYICPVAEAALSVPVPVAVPVPVVATETTAVVTVEPPQETTTQPVIVPDPVTATAVSDTEPVVITGLDEGDEEEEEIDEDEQDDEDYEEALPTPPEPQDDEPLEAESKVEGAPRQSRKRTRSEG